MPSIINALTASGGGVAITGDATGNLALQTAGNTAVTVNTSKGVQFDNCIGVGNATPSTSGAGITFPATQSASTDANTLDDYEEGTFTATIIGTSTAGTATYTTQNARYTKIGRLVQYEIYLAWNSGTGTGTMKIAGLPFTSGNLSTFPAVTIGWINNVVLSANNVATGYVDSNNTTIALEQYPVGGGSMGGVTYDGNGGIIVCGTYSV